MFGCIINTVEIEKLYEKMNLSPETLTFGGLEYLLSVNLTETEADEFNDGNWGKVQKVVDFIEVYDQSGVILTTWAGDFSDNIGKVVNMDFTCFEKNIAELSENNEIDVNKMYAKFGTNVFDYSNSCKLLDGDTIVSLFNIDPKGELSLVSTYSFGRSSYYYRINNVHFFETAYENLLEVHIAEFAFISGDYNEEY